MTLTLQTVEENLKQAEADVEFWKQAKRLLSDPRMAVATAPSVVTAPAPPSYVSPEPYGDVRQEVYKHLPPFGAQPVGTGALVATLLNNGFRFRAKHQQMAVIDALRILETEEKAFMARRDGIAKLWTKGAPKDQGATEVTP
jgi:hypothetical protein